MSLEIPVELLPRDGRFGSGPAKVRIEALAALAVSPEMGTSHRQAPVKDLVKQVQYLLAELYRAPEGYELVLGNGGSSVFWDVAVSSLIERRSAHGVFGEFTRKFANAAAAAPFLEAPEITECAPGSIALPTACDADVYAWAQNETSTGAAAPVLRPEKIADDALVVIDATSSAGGMDVDLSQTDVYYFAPQKNFSSDGGLWLAFCSPAALERANKLAASRWIPESLDLSIAATNSAAQQTLNTPAIATLILLVDQLEWMIAQGGIEFVSERTSVSSSQVYDWADNHPLATPFVTDSALRSPVVATIDLEESINAVAVTSALRANGIVDTEPYRKLGRNQLRIGCYASVDPSDVTRLLRCIDWLLDRPEMRA